MNQIEKGSNKRVYKLRWKPNQKIIASSFDLNAYAFVRLNEHFCELSNFYDINFQLCSFDQLNEHSWKLSLFFILWRNQISLMKSTVEFKGIPFWWTTNRFFLLCLRCWTMIWWFKCKCMLLLKWELLIVIKCSLIWSLNANCTKTTNKVNQMCVFRFELRH